MGQGWGGATHANLRFSVPLFYYVFYISKFSNPYTCYSDKKRFWGQLREVIYEVVCLLMTTCDYGRRGVKKNCQIAWHHFGWSHKQLAWLKLLEDKHHFFFKPVKNHKFCIKYLFQSLKPLKMTFNFAIKCESLIPKVYGGLIFSTK